MKLLSFADRLAVARYKFSLDVLDQMLLAWWLRQQLAAVRKNRKAA